MSIFATFTDHAHTCLAIDVMTKMLAFDPSDRITVPEALNHPWLAAYHDESDEPTCEKVFDRWKEIEKLETIEDFRTALWNEIEDYRREVRGIHILPPMPALGVGETKEAENGAHISAPKEPEAKKEAEPVKEVNGKHAPAISGPPCEPLPELPVTSPPPSETTAASTTSEATAATLVASPETSVPVPPPVLAAIEPEVKLDLSHSTSDLRANSRKFSTSPEQYRNDPVVSYARRSSILLQQQQAQQQAQALVQNMQQAAISQQGLSGGHLSSRRGSTFNSPMPSTYHLPTFFEDSELGQANGVTLPAGMQSLTGAPQSMGSTIAFPTQQPTYVVPARSRTGSTAGGEVTRKVLRTLSTVSIHESSQGRPIGVGLGMTAMPGVPVAGPVQRTGSGSVQSAADAPPSEMPVDFAVGSHIKALEEGGGEEEKKKKKALFHVE